MVDYLYEYILYLKSLAFDDVVIKKRIGNLRSRKRFK